MLEKFINKIKLSTIKSISNWDPKQNLNKFEKEFNIITKFYS